jgi:hypothetical protein
MQYVQLYALDQGATGYAGYVELDLYTQEPIKITKSVLSVDDITSNKSAFSRTFRVPHTTPNGIFFKSVFNVNAVDFDATRRTAAYILVDGSTFDFGNIQLMNIFRNDSTGKIEYEITFLGTTSAFATEVAPRDMSTIDLSDLSHELTYSNIIASWQPGGTGLLNGDIVYPLAEYGYTYTAGVPDQSTLSVFGGTGSTKGFTNPSFPLERGQFKPSIRVKTIWDRIFAGTNYTYTSTFVDNILNQLYTIASNYISPYALPDINFGVAISATTTNSRGEKNLRGDAPLKIPTPTNSVINNPANAWQPLEGYYKVPVSNLTYNFTVNLKAKWGQFNPSSSLDVVLQMRVRRNGVIVQTDSRTVSPNCSPVDRLILQLIPFFLGRRNDDMLVGGPGGSVPILTGLNLQKGDEVEFWINSINKTGYVFFSTTAGGTITLNVPTARMIDPTGFLPTQFKQLEFIKAINDRFKLVWEPDKENPNNFIIEPYNDWVLGGEQKDWTYKLNENSDIAIQPLFYTQPREIIYKDSEESDLYNYSYQQEWKQTFGQRNTDSNIELITGKKEIKSLFAALPVAPIGNSKKFLIPHFAKDTEAQRQPIAIKPRIGFFSLNVDTQGITYYLENDSGVVVPHTTYPLYSSFNSYPFNGTSFDLNWLNPPQFWDEVDLGFDGRTNQTAFTQYWSSWWESLYDPYSRIMEATFALDVEDVIGLSFNDKIFVKDSWWLVLEIKDFVLNAKNNVRVKLLKLGNLGINITGFSAGVKRYLQPSICFSETLCGACCCLTSSAPVYTDGETFATSGTVSYDLANQQPALDGYYFDGTDVYIVSLGNIVSVGTCAGCNCVPGGLVQFSNVCVGTNFCTVCCCSVPEISVWGDGPSLELSSRVFGSTGGTPLTAGLWYKNIGDGAAVQVGPDGTTVVNVATCNQCICNPLEDKSEFVVGTDSVSTCCIQAPNSFGTQSMYTDTGVITTASVFYYDPYEQFPVGGTGTVFVSNGETVVTVNGPTASATGACVFPATGCTGRTEVVPFNVQNAGPTAGEIISTYYISFDGTDYYYNGQDTDAGSSFNVTHNPTYATGSNFQYQFTVPAPYTGSAEVKYYKNATLYLTEITSTPASYNGPNLGPVGADSWNVDVTIQVN